MGRQYSILVVDDEPANVRLLARVLGDDLEVLQATSGADALKVLAEHSEVALIITDQRMPTMSGVQLLRESMSICPDAIRILLTGYTDVEAIIDAINTGHIYKYVSKPWDADELRLTVKRALEAYELKIQNAGLVKDLHAALMQLEDLAMGTIAALADALDAKCDYTAGHSLRVSRYAVVIGKGLGLSDEELKDVELSGILHDIGKIGVPESILWKPAKLNEEERNIMVRHPIRSAQIIGDISVLSRARTWVLHHHEWLDGSGYPDKLVGDQIPLGSRIILVADAYDAMTTDRPYRKSLGHEKAIAELKRLSGTQFDPKCVEALLAAMDGKGEFLSGSMPESFLGLKLPAIDPRLLHKPNPVSLQLSPRSLPKDQSV